MRHLPFAIVTVCLLIAPASAARIQSGQQLVQACTDYLERGAAHDNNVARMPHPCRNFLQGFFVSLISREDARRDAMVKGIPYTSKEKCVRLPPRLTYIDMAQRLINFAKFNPASLQGPAALLAQQTVERDFPCPPPTAR